MLHFFLIKNSYCEKNYRSVAKLLSNLTKLKIRSNLVMLEFFEN